MNDKIKSLLNVCGMSNEDLMEIYSDENKTFYMEKFAELIVKECANLSTDIDDYQNILEHFGVINGNYQDILGHLE